MSIQHLHDHQKVAYKLAIQHGNREIVHFVGMALSVIEEEAARLNIRVTALKAAELKSLKPSEPAMEGIPVLA